MRNSRGQYISGHSGNPSGRPKDHYKVSELARTYTSEAINTLVELMRHGKDERVRGTANVNFIELRLICVLFF